MTTIESAVASKFASLALAHVKREFPNKLDHVFNDAADVKGPRTLHPAFYGCFDWHSAVHNHWLLLRIRRLWPELDADGAARRLLDAHLNPETLGVELAYFDNPNNGAFSRPYGWGWLLRVHAEAVATPGHTANHLAFALLGTGVLFSGDHVMAWSTPVVSPPDGSMSDYMASLEKLVGRPESIYFPGHGGAVMDAHRFVSHYIRHRRGREQSILQQLAKGEADIPALVAAIYVGLDPRLVRAAGYSVLAHLEDLAERGRVATQGAPSIEGRYRLLGA